jgi:hypothetical protein
MRFDLRSFSPPLGPRKIASIRSFHFGKFPFRQRMK